MELCTNWNQVNIRQYIELTKLKNDVDAIDFQVKVIAILSGKTEREISMLPIDELKDLTAKTKFIYKLPESTMLPTVIQLEGKKYQVNYQIEKLTGYGYADLKNYTKDQDTTIDNLHNVLSLFIVPVKRKWFKWVPVVETIEQRNEKAQLFLNHLSVGVAVPMSLFFCELLNNLTTGIQDFMLEKAKNQTQSLRRSLINHMS